MTAPTYFDHNSGVTTRPSTDTVEWESLVEEVVMEGEKGEGE